MMQISKGVEWACHAAVLLAALPEKRGLRADALARYHEVPAAYMAKQMQALSKAGIVQTYRGAKGGYRLARPPADITLWDITAALEGAAPAFRCTEIRQNGPCGSAKKDCRTPCSIAASFHRAEQAFRNSLQSVTVADIFLQTVHEKSPASSTKAIAWLEVEGVDLTT